jgi:hypothetical protein
VLPIKLTMNNNKNDRIARHTLIKNWIQLNPNNIE